MMRFSIIILSYNTKKLTQQCLESLVNALKVTPTLSYEIIVVDNGSKDGSIEMLKSLKSKTINFKLILNGKNLGYPKGNNQAARLASGKYILFLNSDTILSRINFEEVLTYLDNHSKIAVLTVKVLLSDGEKKSIDPASHRGFPTIWNSFCYFLGLEKLFKETPLLNTLFGGYHLVHLNLTSIHEIDSPSGAFYLIRREIFRKLNGFDENFFMYGEDIDLSFRVKNAGYKILYYPYQQVIHLKHASGLAKRDEKTRERTTRYFYDAMKIFYRKHYEKMHSSITNKVVYFFIDFKKKLYV